MGVPLLGPRTIRRLAGAYSFRGAGWSASQDLGVKTTGLAYLSLFVGDLDASKHFYSDILGLPIVVDEEWGAMVQAGAVQLILHPREDRTQEDVELVFNVEDLDAAFAELRRAGVAVLEDPQLRDWGDKDGAVADPDGNRIYLRESPTARA